MEFELDFFQTRVFSIGEESVSRLSLFPSSSSSCSLFFFGFFFLNKLCVMSMRKKSHPHTGSGKEEAHKGVDSAHTDTGERAKQNAGIGRLRLLTPRPQILVILFLSCHLAACVFVSHSEEAIHSFLCMHVCVCVFLFLSRRPQSSPRVSVRVCVPAKSFPFLFAS